ncbi:MAG: 4Fe-4S binding protein, partial [Clostridia bacterium]|nr:4Fe-4S binding protein [Clostridia bacterium]
MLSFFKYVLLVIVIAVPVIYAGIPSFCKYVCPAGTLEGAVGLLANIKNADLYGMLGYLFTWKFCLLVVFVVASTFIYRFFCRFICPLGAIYSLFNRFSLLGVKLDKNKCIDCGLCIQGCKMDIRHVGDHECIMCGECISVCPVQAISWKGSQIFVKNTTPAAQPVLAEGEKVDLLSRVKSNASLAVINPSVSDAEKNSNDVTEVGADSADVPAETAGSEEISAKSAETAEAAEAVAVKQSRRQAFKNSVKSAFKRPRFVVEFVAWVVALAVLLGAFIGYGVRKDSSVMVYKVGDKCPEFILQTYKSDNDVTEFNTFSHDKVTVINYWYTTCDPCKAELPYFEKVYEEYDGAIDMFVVHNWSGVPSS